MDLNATLFGQIITFAVFIWFTVKFVWPPLMKIMEDRRQKIADGLAAAQKNQDDLELTQHKVREQMAEAKAAAAHIIEQANQRAHRMVDEAKDKAREEGERLLKLAQAEIEQEYSQAREKLIGEISHFAILGAEKILKENLDNARNDKLVSDLMREIH